MSSVHRCARFGRRVGEYGLAALAACFMLAETWIARTGYLVALVVFLALVVAWIRGERPGLSAVVSAAALAGGVVAFLADASACLWLSTAALGTVLAAFRTVRFRTVRARTPPSEANGAALMQS